MFCRVVGLVGCAFGFAGVVWVVVVSCWWGLVGVRLLVCSIPIISDGLLHITLAV